MTAIDMGIIGFLLYQCFQGLKRGLIRVIFDLSAIFIGIHFGIRYYTPIAHKITEYGVTYSFSKGLSFIAIWLTIVAFVSLVSRGVDQIIQPSFVGTVNRIGGALFGLAKGLVLVMPLILLLILFQRGYWEQSVVVKPIRTMYHYYLMQPQPPKPNG